MYVQFRVDVCFRVIPTLSDCLLRPRRPYSVKTTKLSHKRYNNNNSQGMMVWLDLVRLRSE